jgi:hypothetical protein
MTITGSIAGLAGGITGPSKGVVASTHTLVAGAVGVVGYNFLVRLAALPGHGWCRPRRQVASRVSTSTLRRIANTYRSLGLRIMADAREKLAASYAEIAAQGERIRQNSAEVAILQGRVQRKLPDDEPPKGEQNPLRRRPVP